MADGCKRVKRHEDVYLHVPRSWLWAIPAAAALGGLALMWAVPVDKALIMQSLDRHFDKMVLAARCGATLFVLTAPQVWTAYRRGRLEVYSEVFAMAFVLGSMASVLLGPFGAMIVISATSLISGHAVGVWGD